MVCSVRMSNGRAEVSGDPGSALVDESLIDATMAQSPEERLRQNDRMVRTILLLRKGFEAQTPGEDGPRS
jgi:hypothetical protein